MATMLHADSLVQDAQRHFGRFDSTPIANPYDAFTGARRAYEWFRTKEWVGFTLMHPDMASSMIIQDAKYLATGEFYVFDRHDGGLWQYSANRLGGTPHLPADLLQAKCAFISGGLRFGYAFSTDQVMIAIDIDATATAPAVRGRLNLSVSRASQPLVVSAMLPGGLMYTNKIIYPASGVITCGDKRYVFEPDRDFAILDEHKSHLPYRTEWTWGTFAMPVPGGIAGANMGTRPSLPDQEEESCIWTPAAVEPLSNIVFTQLTDDEMSAWHIQSQDGRVDVTFTPEGHKDANQNLVVAEIHYSQWFGHYDGLLHGANETWHVDHVPGVCEHMLARL